MFLRHSVKGTSWVSEYSFIIGPAKEMSTAIFQSQTFSKYRAYRGKFPVTSLVFYVSYHALLFQVLGCLKSTLTGRLG